MFRSGTVRAVVVALGGLLVGELVAVPLAEATTTAPVEDPKGMPIASEAPEERSVPVAGDFSTQWPSEVVAAGTGSEPVVPPPVVDEPEPAVVDGPAAPPVMSEVSAAPVPLGVYRVGDPTMPEEERLAVAGPPIELVEKRTETARVFRNPDGSEMAEIHARPIHFLDAASGVMRGIDSRLVERGVGWVGNAAGPVAFDLARVGGAGSWVRASGHSWSLSFRPEHAASRPALVSGRSVRYESVRDGVDLVYRMSDSDLKEEIVLRDRQAAAGGNRWRFPLTVDGLRSHTDGDGTIRFYEVDGDEEVLVIRPGVAFDSSGGGAARCGPPRSRHGSSARAGSGRWRCRSRSLSWPIRPRCTRSRSTLLWTRGARAATGTRSRRVPARPATTTARPSWWAPSTRTRSATQARTPARRTTAT